jgi:SAM-dependent methyltransferase
MSETVDYALHYSEYHRTDEAYFEEWFKQNRRFLDTLVADIRDRPIIDVGCGFGLLVYALLRLGCRQVLGIDVSGGQIQVAQSRGLPCELVSEPAQQAFLAARRDEFGAVFLFDVLEHLPPARQIEFLRMLRLALAPGGRLLLQVPNASSPIAAHMRYIDPTHTSAFTVDSLRFVLTGAGFGSVTICDAHDEMSAAVSLLEPMRLMRKTCGRLVRLVWRVLYLSEFGRPGRNVPLGRNLLAIAQTEPAR